MIDKTYDPAHIEPKQHQRWHDLAAFRVATDPQKQPYTIMMPPPNVTGRLHIGHALNHTLQDILVRYHRMLGKDVLWQPGTDHAGIATQMVVERALGEEGISRHDIGRGAFLEHVWSWKKKYGGAIVEQLKALGVSADWSRERFTLDAGLSHAVRQVFVTLYQDKLIYRDKRLVNWDLHLQTAVSDLEVKMEEKPGTLWYIRYPLVADPTCHITVATTRPETLFGDQAIVVHPEDTRYTNLIGQQVKVPLTDRVVPIIADDMGDPEKGSGAVKITPAHDFHDFEVGQRHNLPLLNILTSHGQLNENVPAPYKGIDRFKARQQVLADLQAQGLLAQEEAITHSVPVGDRSDTILEPWLTDQWFVKADILAQPAIKAVEQEETKFVPENWTKVYYEWLRNIQPWCISRQLWWGHRIPAWYGPDGRIFVAMSEEEAYTQAQAYYQKEVALSQDPDVLDTWFSSALWPFSTLGWPEETADLQRYFPTSTLVTGHDIIFFWVARMMMMSLYFMQQVPFKEVYITALVRDAKGQKMSKSKGNVIDPIESIATYGADALRFSLASLAGPGRNVNFSLQQVQGYRNFATKLWNVARFCHQNDCVYDAGFDPNACQHPINRWMIGALKHIIEAVTVRLNSYRFDESCHTLYQFIWGTFCDWYIELAKGLFQEGTAAEQAEVKASVAWGLRQLIALLHPVMPYITEEIWQTYFNEEAPLCQQPWPLGDTLPEAAPALQEDMAWLQEFVTTVRSARNEVNIAPGAWLSMYALGVPQGDQQRLKVYASFLRRLARLDKIELAPQASVKGLTCVIAGASYVIPVEGIIDVAKEKARLQGKMQDVTKRLKALENKLANPKFMDHAPAEIIADVKEEHTALLKTQAKIAQTMKQILK